MRRIRRRSAQYVVREQLISRETGILAPTYFGPGSRRECERRRDQLNAEPLLKGCSSRDVSLHRLFSLFGGSPPFALPFKRSGIAPAPGTHAPAGKAADGRR